MTLPDQLRAVVAEGHTIRCVEEGIYSVLSDTPQIHLYDKRAAIYDYKRVV
ncbi:MAG TPA: hypothetical protein VJ023_12750 [Pyrinomonadaceae bacterium]|nr:hypothetical protein [Pyrinomonadaceae bacterium]